MTLKTHTKNKGLLTRDTTWISMMDVEIQLERIFILDFSYEIFQPFCFFVDCDLNNSGKSGKKSAEPFF